MIHMDSFKMEVNSPDTMALKTQTHDSSIGFSP